MKDKRFWKSILLFLGGQSLLYFIIKFFQVDYHTFDMGIDNKIPFIPQFIIIYNLFYPFLFLCFLNIFNKDKVVYDKGIIAGIMGYLIANIIFLIYPVEMIRPDITNINMDILTKFILKLTYKFDNPAINCLPSIHCLFCFQSIYSTVNCNHLSKNKKIIISVIALLIIISVLFVKQHYVIDMIGAFIIFIIVNIIVELGYQRVYKNTNFR